jgi:iron complex outermembrane receptor protein
MNPDRYMFNKKAAAVILTALLVFALSAPAVLSGSLSGKITDNSDGMPLPGATVTLFPSDPEAEPIGALTDDEGFFAVKNIPADTYALTVSFIGFSPERMATFVVGETDELTFDRGLIPTAINLSAISVTASRKPEKLLEAPASVDVIHAEDIEDRATLTTTEHLKTLPAVDIATTGLNQSNVVVRGFNNIFSGAMLVLTDNRIARVPSLRFNAYNFIPTINEDIERIEIVSGPGSALYGPNASTGVMHMITKSPFGSEGTTVSIGGGERELFSGSFRHAGSHKNQIGYKVSGQYYQGLDWKRTEPSEEQEPIIQLFRPSNDGREYIGEPFANERDFDIERMSGEGRLDYLASDNTALTFNAGFNRSSSIELTGLGAGQAIDWTYWYAQSRLTYKDLFLQAFVNGSDAGDTYLLNTGQMIVDKSRLWVGQVQHSYAPSDRTRFTYGIDVLLTRPNTDGTINGRNEDDDNINEIGGYLQGDFQLNERFKFVGAFRVDDNDQLEDLVFSPRAALTFQPNDQHNLRATYNRAFSTPDNNNLYLDLLQSANPFRTGIDVRVQGVPESGFHFRFDGDDPMFRSQLAPAIGGEASDYFALDDPLFTNVMWGAGSGAIQDGFAAALAADTLTSPMIDSVVLASLVAVTPNALPGLTNVMYTLDPDVGGFVPTNLDNLADIDRMRPTITETFEIGYKGVLFDRLRFSVDAYRTEKNDFVGPLTVETPNVFLDGPTLYGELRTVLENTLADPNNAGYVAALMFLDELDQGGNADGIILDELLTMYTNGVNGVPVMAFGTVTPEEALNPTDVLITYRNFGDIAFYGADFGFDYHLNRNWDFGGSYSYVSKNFFDEDQDGNDLVHEIRLNAPRHKYGLRAKYTNSSVGLTVGSRLRFVDAFEMASPFFGSEVKAYTVVDLTTGIDVMTNMRFALTVQNILDNKHAEFVGAPEIGRLTIARLTQTF